jgi:predicted secreted protein
MKRAPIVATALAVGAMVALAAGVALAGPSVAVRDAGVKTVKAKICKTVQVKQGQHIHIVLRGNFTTGYDWRLVSGTGSVVKPDGKRGYTVDSELAGSPGKVDIPYRAVGAGNTTLVFQYKQWWDKTQPALQTFAVCIESVAGPGSGGMVRVVGKPVATQIVVDAGEPFDIQLRANPSTGYGWEVVKVDSAVVGDNGEPTFVPDSAAMGAPGTLTWHFVAKAKGSTTLKMADAAPGGSGAPAYVYAVTVVVQ